jgi:hypothetical protein
VWSQDKLDQAIIARYPRMSRLSRVARAWVDLLCSVASNISQAVGQLRTHPQDHGWQQFFRAVDILLREQSPILLRVLQNCLTSRPQVSATHVVTLLAQATKMALHRDAPAIGSGLGVESSTPFQFARRLERTLARHERLIAETLVLRQNSFTSARRFLLPQIVLSRYFRRLGLVDVNFLDIGTGLGLLPRQLDKQHIFERFSPDLLWPDGVSPFTPISIGKRFGADRAPLPDLEWVRHCYGPSSYYDGLLTELQSVLEDPGISSEPVELVELDILDTDRLGEFIRDNRIHAANCSFVLYQYEQEARKAVVKCVVQSLQTPGLFISMEPRGELAVPGCEVRLYESGDLKPILFAVVTDGHFLGRVVPSLDFQSFTESRL